MGHRNIERGGGVREAVDKDNVGKTDKCEGELEGKWSVGEI